MSSLPTTIDLFGSLDRKGNQRANNTTTAFNTGFNARHAVDSSSESTTVCAGSSYDRISSVSALANVDSARSVGTRYWGAGTGGNSSNDRMRFGRSMGQYKSMVLVLLLFAEIRYSKLCQGLSL